MGSGIHDNDPIVVNIVNGPIQGKKQIIVNKTIYTFLGVPYAEPPINSRRFKRSVPLQSTWSAPLPCLQYQSSCVQHRFLAEYFDRTDPNGTEMRISEDCLYLNIFTPTIQKSDSLPVVVWIHGGSFIYGSGAWWHGQTLSSVENVVVVTINYRLGLFGYLGVRNKAGKAIIEPNLSLLDQNLALKWIQNNIHQFGGNPKNVVLAGHSAGAIAISYHLLSPVSRGLFQNVALYGGSCLMLQNNDVGWPYIERIFASVLSKTTCNNTNYAVEESVECLKKISVDELLSAQLHVFQSEFYPFRPAIDSSVVPNDPLTLFEQGLINPVDNILLGTTRDEGVTVTMRIPHFQHGISREAMMHLVHLVYFNYPSEVRSLIIHQYTDYSNHNDAVNNAQIANRLFTQALFQAPIARMANLLAKYNYSSYIFNFDHRTIGSAYYPDYVGIVHQMEVPYIFGYPLHHPDYIHDNYTADDKKVSKYMMRMICNMARNRTLISNTNWTAYTPLDTKYLHVNPKIQLRDSYIPGAVTFWNAIIPSLLKSSQESERLANQKHQNNIIKLQEEELQWKDRFTVKGDCLDRVYSVGLSEMKQHFMANAVNLLLWHRCILCMAYCRKGGLYF